jgi:hypothetical protein
MSTGKNPPVHRINFFGCQVAIWANQNGHSVTVKFSYKDKQANAWKSSDFIGAREIPSMQYALGEALRWIQANRQPVAPKPQTDDWNPPSNGEPTPF